MLIYAFSRNIYVERERQRENNTCIYIERDEITHVCMNECMYVCMYVQCMECVYIYIYMYMYTYDAHIYIEREMYVVIDVYHMYTHI